MTFFRFAVNATQKETLKDLKIKTFGPEKEKKIKKRKEKQPNPLSCLKSKKKKEEEEHIGQHHNSKPKKKKRVRVKIPKHVKEELLKRNKVESQDNKLMN